MYIFLPNNDTTVNDFLENFTEDIFNAINRLEYDKKTIELKLPKFTLDNSYAMKNVSSFFFKLIRSFCLLKKSPLPKLKLNKKKSFHIFRQIFNDMGISNLFGAESNFSDFSSATQLHFNDIIHKAKIEINKCSTTFMAAGSTVDVSNVSNAVANSTKTNVSHQMNIKTEQIQFHSDRPFVFMIYDQITKEMLFAGVYREAYQN